MDTTLCRLGIPFTGSTFSRISLALAWFALGSIVIHFEAKWMEKTFASPDQQSTATV
jgi:hypothetical protein